MATEIRFRRGTTAQHSTFTGASGEVTVDTDKKTLVVHDGVTPGGTPLPTTVTNIPTDNSVSTVKIQDNAVTNAKMADNSVNTAEIVNGALSADVAGRAKMANGFVTGAKVEQNLIPEFVRGLTLSNNTGTPNTHIDISTGAAKLGSLVVTNSSTLTKRLNATWAAGSGNGGLDTGTSAINSTYHIYSLRKQSDGSFDAVFSTSATGPNTTLLSGYDVIQRLGAVRTGGTGNIITFVQVGNIFRIAETQDFTASASVAQALLTLSVPTGVKVRALMRFQLTTSGGASDVSVVTAPGGNATLLYSQAYSGQQAGALSTIKVSTGSELTNTSAQIYRTAVVNGGGGQTVFIHTAGWEDITIPRVG